MFTVAHMFEEAWGGFWISHALGLGWFLLVNWLLLCIPAVFFYFILMDRRWAYYAGMLYGGFMALNGAGHIVLTLVTGRYPDFAGSISGIALVITGPIVVWLLVKQVRWSR